MSLEAFIDIRFGDPVISLSLNSDGLVYGSMMGRILYYQFESREERVINEISDEFISGVYLSRDNVLHACIGDLKTLIISDPDAERLRKRYVMFEKLHTAISCELSQIKMHKDTVFIGILEPNSTSNSLTHTISPIHIIELSSGTQRAIEGIRFPPFSIIFDFDGYRLLWMEFTEDARTLSLYTIGHEVKEIKKMPKNSGKVAFCRLLGDSIVFIYRQRIIKVMGEDGEDRGEIGRHSEYIVAMTCAKVTKVERDKRIQRINGKLNDSKSENTEIDFRDTKEQECKTFIITADLGGNIKLWDSGCVVEEIKIGNLPQLTEKYKKMQYFSMGYPYMIEACGKRIAISTDLGVLLIRSQALELYSQLIR